MKFKSRSDKFQIICEFILLSFEFTRSIRCSISRTANQPSHMTSRLSFARRLLTAFHFSTVIYHQSHTELTDTAQSHCKSLALFLNLHPLSRGTKKQCFRRGYDVQGYGRKKWGYGFSLSRGTIRNYGGTFFRCPGVRSEILGVRFFAVQGYVFCGVRSISGKKGTQTIKIDIMLGVNFKICL